MDRIGQILREELTKQEVKNLISDKLGSYTKEKELENRIKEVVTDVMEKFFRMMYNKRGFWKGDLK